MNIAWNNLIASQCTKEMSLMFDKVCYMVSLPNTVDMLLFFINIIILHTLYIVPHAVLELLHTLYRLSGIFFARYLSTWKLLILEILGQCYFCKGDFLKSFKLY